jgi:hypothetical protein
MSRNLTAMARRGKPTPQFDQPARRTLTILDHHYHKQWPP